MFEDLKISLLKPKGWNEDNDGDYIHYYVLDKIIKRIPKLNIEKEFIEDIKYELVDLIRRLIISLKEETGKIRTTEYVAYLKFEFIDPNIIHMRGDFRYGSGEMAEKN